MANQPPSPADANDFPDAPAEQATDEASDTPDLDAFAERIGTARLSDQPEAESRDDWTSNIRHLAGEVAAPTRRWVRRGLDVVSDAVAGIRSRLGDRS